MKRGCAFSLIVWIVLVGAYGYVAWQKIHEWMPAMMIGVLGGTFASILVGSFVGLFSGASDRAAFRRAGTLEAFQDARLEAAAGPIRPLGPPLAAPFTGRPCVAYEYDVKPPGGEHSEFAGVALAPCAIETPRGPVNLLGWALLDQFPRTPVDPGDRARGASYLQSSTFEPLGLTSIVSVLSDLLADDDGTIRKDFRIGEAPIDLQGRTIEERIVPAGAVVTLLGRWSEEKRGFAPAGGTSINRLWPGDLEHTSRDVKGTAVRSFGIGLFFFVALHAILVPMYLLAPSAGGSASGSPPSVWDERDCDRQKALLAAGADPNEVGRDGLTPLMNAARLGETPCVQNLLAAGARLEAADNDGDTALAQAIVAGRDDNIDALRQAGATDFRVTASTGRPVTDTSAPVAVVKDYLAAVHRGDFETMARLMAGASVERMEAARANLPVWQSVRPKAPTLVEGWLNDQAATLTLAGATADGERRVRYHLEMYRLEAGPGTWRIKKEWFPDVR